MTDSRIPIYLLTGYLGSGKTSLLKAWLDQPEFKGAALIINELGEVGLDNQLLASSSTESSALIANACVCCTGLPGLAEALEDLFWARLERRMERFPMLVIETTGLAEPAPVLEAICGESASDLLKERYRMAGVITCISSSTADQVLTQHGEARAQLAGADVVVLTKTDLIDSQTLSRLALQLGATESLALLGLSAHASLTAAQILALLDQKHAHRARDEQHHEHEHGHGHGQDHSDHHDHLHSHTAQSYWWPVAEGFSLAALEMQIQNVQRDLGADLLRLKGRVMTDVGARLIQLAPFDPVPSITVDEMPHTSEELLGLTVITSKPYGFPPSRE
jgi:G3E family GTPase